MSKTRKDKTPKQVAGRCCFCGGTGLSKEHFWPEWMHKYLPTSDKYQRTKRVSNAIVDQITRDGSTKNIQLKRVCEKNCNNGWMSRLENDVAKPLLTPMLEGAKLSLLPSDQADLAFYFQMKAMVADQTYPKDKFYVPDELKALYKHRTLPATTRICLYRYAPGFGVIPQYNREVQNIRALGEKIPVAVNFTFRLHDLYVRVIMHRTGGVNSPQEWKPGDLNPLSTTDVVCPSWQVSSDAEAHFIQQSLKFQWPEMERRLRLSGVLK